jgi:maleylpyruvate isomerase
VAFELDPADPAAAAADLSAAVHDATELLLQTAAGLSDQEAREASLLPGWTRGHVLTHISRNADSLRNLLIWARTGVVTPQYADAAERDRGIAAGAGRPADELVADLATSAAGLAAEANSLEPGAWASEVRGLSGDPHPAWYALWRRLTEVEIHHVDLRAGYGAADWPYPFTVASLHRVAASFTDAPSARLLAVDADLVLQIGPPQATSAVEISGPARALLAWLTGRSAGGILTATPAGPLPTLPAW